MKNFIIYKHTSPNGKAYIGLTTKTLNERAGNNGRCYKHNTYFYRAIIKYGWKNFKHEILFKNINTSKIASKLEIEAITLFKSNNPIYGYNITSGGEFFKHSQKSKQLISNALTGIKRSDIVKKNKSESMCGKDNHNYGKSFTLEHRSKISESNKGRSFSEEHKSKLAEAHKGQVPTKYQLEAAAKVKSRPVIQLTTNNIINKFSSAAEASRRTGIDNSAIIKVCKNKRKKAGGFIWKYDI